VRGFFLFSPRALVASMILIVDDKAENIFSLRRTLEIAGFEVDEAGSGEEALRKVLKQDYALIILDVQMPGMDGFEVAEALQGYSKAADIPVIFLSAVNTEKKFITKGYQAGAVDYVVKPVDPDVFLLKVKTLVRLHDQHRELLHIRQTLLDEIAVRRRAEAELAARVEELRTILHSIPQIAFTLSAAGRLEFFNDHWARAIGADKPLPTPHPDDAPVLQAVQHAINAGESFQGELRFRPAGEDVYRWYLLRLVAVKHEGAIVRWVGTFTDIQDRKAASDQLAAAVELRTAELRQKMEELEESNAELQQFASVASHDLREPLRKIQLFGSVLQRKTEADGMREDVARIMAIAGRMSALVNDLLHYSRLSVVTSFHPVDLGDVVQEILLDFEHVIAEKSAAVQTGVLPVVEAVPGQMRQLFQNLISNALKFSMPSVRPEISITATTTERDGEPVCAVCVADNGIGLDEEYAEKAFSLFGRLHAATDYEGTGIGLAIVKKIADKHRGAVSVESAEGQGARFTVTLPLFQPLEQWTPDPLESAMEAGSSPSKDQAEHS